MIRALKRVVLASFLAVGLLALGAGQSQAGGPFRGGYGGYRGGYGGWGGYGGFRNGYGGWGGGFRNGYGGYGGSYGWYFPPIWGF